MTIGTREALIWLKGLGALGDDVQWTTYRFDASKEKQVGVWSSGDVSGVAEPPLGGRGVAFTKELHVYVQLHWNRSAAETELAARALCEKLAFNPAFDADGVTSSCVILRRCDDARPDDNGICNQTIQFDIYYQEG